MERIMRRFLWNGTGEGKRAPLVKWDLCKASKPNGGLGILDLDCFNKALLIKWLWRYIIEVGSWWRELIASKYQHKHSIWITQTLKYGFGSSPWAGISKHYSTLWKLAYFDPGNGCHLSFWYDCWSPGVVLADSFPRIAAAVTAPEARIADVYISSGESFSWVLDFNYRLRGGAESEKNELLDFLNSLNFAENLHNPCRPVWAPNVGSSFSVASVYRCLADDAFPGVPDFPDAVIWKNIIPPKICFFIWTLSHGRIPTIDKLQRVGWELANRCELCRQSEETQDHLFASCGYSMNVWNLIGSKCRINTQPRSSIIDVIRSWPSRSSDGFDD
ncbi:unnamed protein product [Linum trigynum]|uniref:Reverse transcriptase zinc-binding domain-containing protein n=1 Tax=Linum trigynum TaxID=586398 RepID=A0AAV2DT73_9ROSI